MQGEAIPIVQLRKDVNRRRKDGRGEGEGGREGEEHPLIYQSQHSDDRRYSLPFPFSFTGELPYEEIFGNTNYQTLIHRPMIPHSSLHNIVAPLRLTIMVHIVPTSLSRAVYYHYTIAIDHAEYYHPNPDKSTQ